MGSQSCKKKTEENKNTTKSISDSELLLSSSSPLDMRPRLSLEKACLNENIKRTPVILASVSNIDGIRQTPLQLSTDLQNNQIEYIYVATVCDEYNSNEVIEPQVEDHSDDNSLSKYPITPVCAPSVVYSRLLSSPYTTSIYSPIPTFSFSVSVPSAFRPPPKPIQPLMSLKLDRRTVDLNNNKHVAKPQTGKLVRLWNFNGNATYADVRTFLKVSPLFYNFKITDLLFTEQEQQALV